VTAAFEVTGLRKVYQSGGLLGGRRHVALDNVSIALPGGAGQVLSVVGESGSGKTTLARCILRLMQPDAGRITLGDRAIVGAGSAALASLPFRRLVQPVFQNPFETFSLKLPVEEYLVRTAINLGRDGPSGAVAAVRVALTAVGLDPGRVGGRGVRAFSGGELQRISVARALLADPELIVADEPVSMVDASLRMTIVNLFRRLAGERGITFVYITHDLSTAYYLSDRMVIMRAGAVVEAGAPDEVLRSPRDSYTRLLMDSIATLDHRWVD
jgi:ABC-type glutathione transport system ATPase component